MSELSKQLVENERKREQVRAEAQRLGRELIALLAMGDDESVAELDVGTLATLAQRLASQKFAMRNLRKEHRDLAAQA